MVQTLLQPIAVKAARVLKWCLVAFITLATVAFVLEYVDAYPVSRHLFKRDVALTAGSLPQTERDRLANFHKDPKLGGLEAWISLAQSMRTNLRTGKTLTLKNGSLDVIQTVQDYALPTAVVAGLLIAFGVIWLIIDIFMCVKCICGTCCRCCLAKGLAKPTKHVRIILITLLSGISFVYISSFVSGISGAAVLQQGIVNTKGSIIRIGDDAKAQLLQVNPTIDDIFTSLNTTLISSLEELKNAVGIEEFLVDVDSIVDGIVLTLRSTGETIERFKNNGTAIGTATEAIKDLTAETEANFTTSINDYSTLDGPQTEPGTNIVYELNAAASANWPTAPNVNTLFGQDFNTAPNVSSYMEPFLPPQIPDLIDKANFIDTQFSTATEMIPEAFDNQTRAVRENMGATFAGIKDGLKGTVNIDTYTGSITSLQTTLETVVDGNLAKYEPIIRGVSIGFFSFVGVVVLLVLVGTFTKRPATVRMGTYPFMIFIIFVCIIGGILLILATVTGDLCYWMNEKQKFGPWLSPINTLTGFDTSAINYYYSIRSDCVGGSTILNALANAGIVDASQVNISQIASQQLDSLNFTELATQFDASSSFNLGDLNQQMSSFTGGNISDFGFDKYLEEANNAFITPELDYFLGNLTVFRDALTVTSFDYNNNVGPAPSAQDQTACLNDFKSKINNIIDSITSTRDQSSALANSYTDAIATGTNNLQLLSVEAKVKVDSLLPQFDNLTATIDQYGTGVTSNIINDAIPQVKENVRSFVNEVVSMTEDRFSCRGIALGLYATENSVCGYFQGGLDAVWFSLFLIGILSFIAIPVFFKAASRLARRTFTIRGGAESLARKVIPDNVSQLPDLSKRKDLKLAPLRGAPPIQRTAEVPTIVEATTIGDPTPAPAQPQMMALMPVSVVPVSASQQLMLAALPAKMPSNNALARHSSANFVDKELVANSPDGVTSPTGEDAPLIRQ